MISIMQPVETPLTINFKYQNKNVVIGGIGYNTFINSLDVSTNNNTNHFVANLQIGNYSSIADGVHLHLNRNHDFLSVSNMNKDWLKNIFIPGHSDDIKIKQKGQVIIGNDVWIGSKVMIMGGVSIGNGAIVGAGAVVAKDIPPYAIAVGNPVKITRYRFDKEYIDKLLEIKWWNWNIDFLKKNQNWFSMDIAKFTNEFYIKNETGVIEKDPHTNSILFEPDFEESQYPVWRNVVGEFIKKFRDEKRLRLLVCGDTEKQIQIVRDLVESLGGASNVEYIYKKNDINSVFRRIDFFVTTRNINTISYFDLCQEHGVALLSGVDIPVFLSEELLP